jgi:hypothetical protein
MLSRMPTPPLCPTLLQLNLENWLDRATVSRISGIGHVGRSFAEANQFVIRNRSNALPELFHRECRFRNHLSPRFGTRVFPLRHFLGHEQE